MDRTRSLLRRTYAFGAVAVVSLAVVVLRASRDVESRTVERLPATFPAIDIDKQVKRVEIQRKTKKDDKPVVEKVVLERTGLESWVVQSSSGYPADHRKIGDALKDLAKVKTRSVPTTNPAKFGEFAEKDEGFIDVRVYGEGDEPLVSFGVGRNNAEGSYSNVFVRVDDVGDAAQSAGKPLAAMAPDGGPAGAGTSTGKIVTATGIETYTWRDRAQVTPWIETRIFPTLSENDIADVTWTHAPKEFSAVLMRGDKPPKDPKDPNAKEPEEPYLLSVPSELPSPAKRDSAKQFFSTLAGLRLAALEGLASADSDAKYGFDKPDLVVIGKGKPPKDGVPAPLWKIEVGKKVEGKSSYYVRRTASSAIEITGPDKWVFTVEDYELSRYRDDPKDLLEKKPEPPPAAPAMDGAAMTEPAMTEPAMDGAAMGEPAMDGAAMTEPGMAEPAMDGAAMTEPAMDGAGMTEPAMGEPAMDGAAMDAEAPPAMSEPPSMPAMGDGAAMGEAPPAPAMGEPAPR